MSEILGTVRASSWPELFDCSYRWYWKNIMGVRLPSHGATQVGNAIHKGAAIFDAMHVIDKAAGRETTAATVNAAVEAAVEAIERPTNEKGDAIDVLYDEDMSKSDATDFSVQLTAKYCTGLALTKDYTAIEVKCVGLDLTTEHGILRLSGTTDRIERRALPNRIGYDEGIGDLKSGAKAVGTDGRAVTKGHHLQMGIYTIMTEAEVKRPMGDARIYGFQTTNKLRIGEGIIENPKRALVGTGDVPGLLEIAAGMLRAGVFPPNPKSILCSRKWCPAYDRCIYHD